MNKDIIIKNLSDGDIYSDEEIAFLSDTSVTEVRRVLNDPTIFRTCGDGSGVIYIMDIKYDTIVDGFGFRNSVYCSKCDVYCEGCHNKQSWKLENGKPITVNDLANILNSSDSDVTFTGGECSLQANAFTQLAKKLVNKNIWLYTGHYLDELLKDKNCSELLKYVNVVVDSPFEIRNRLINGTFKGSSNQRIFQNKNGEWLELILD